MQTKRIGFVGLGLMGKGMVGNLLSSGFSVTGYDIDPSQIAASVEMGAAACKDPADLIDKVDVIMLSLPNSHVVNDVVSNGLKLFKVV